MTLRDLVTRELERVVKVHLADGISIKRARIERPFRYRFAFDDLSTHVDCAIDAERVLTTTVTDTEPREQPEATVRLAATKLSHLFIIARQQGVFDAETFAAIGELGFAFEGSLDLHRTVLELVGGAPSHFQAALDSIDHTVTNSAIDHLVYTTHEETEEAARHAVRESRPLLVRGFPFSWNGMTREVFLTRYGTHEAWVEGQLIPLEVFAADHNRATTPSEAYSPVNPTDAVYATNLVAPDPLARIFTTPLFEDRCGPSRLFGGRSVLEDGAAWARVTRPHRHAHDVVAWQVFGKKKWIVVPPAHRTPLELRPLGFDTQFCGVLDPDLIDDPAFQKAATTIVMEPGELLVLPGGWFHVTYVTREPALGFSAFARDDILRFAP